MGDYRTLNEADPTPEELEGARLLAELLDPPVSPSKRLLELDPRIKEINEATRVSLSPEPSMRLMIDNVFDSTLSKLPSLYSTAIRLRLDRDLDRCECAERLAISPSTFDVILYRAMNAYGDVNAKLRWVGL